jgi:hypothetical protein
MGKFQFKMENRSGARPKKAEGSGWLQPLLLIAVACALIYALLPYFQS